MLKIRGFLEFGKGEEEGGNVCFPQVKIYLMWHILNFSLYEKIYFKTL